LDDSFGDSRDDVRDRDGDHDIDNNGFPGFVALSDLFDVFLIIAFLC
jgi:hypothetical protein